MVDEKMQTNVEGIYAAGLLNMPQCLRSAPQAAEQERI